MSRRPFSIGDSKGSLQIVAVAGKHRGYILWECLCDCGKTCTRTATQLSRSLSPNCRDASHSVGAWYPPAPVPYPDDAAAISEKYLHLVQRFENHAQYQDLAMERLLRHAWICAYRQRIGDPLPDESNYMRKCLRLKFNQKASVRVKFELKHEQSCEAPMEVSSLTYQTQLAGETMRPIKTRFRRC